jgi:molybdopterin-synthase adenylyltransferase
MRIVIIGCGTTGNQIIPLLEGDLLLIDRDIVEEKNLGRQQLYTAVDVGKPKALVLGERFSCSAKVMDLDYTNVTALDADLVIDCTDNLATRFLINEYCKKNSIPWIYTAVVGDRGRVLAFTGPVCFRCLFTEAKGLDTCSTVGVDLDVARGVGVVAVEEAQRVLAGKRSRGLWANGEWVSVQNDPSCPVCFGDYPYLQGKGNAVVKFCGSNRYQFKGHFDFLNVKERLGGTGDWFIYENHYIFQDRVLVHAASEQEAKKTFTALIGC